MTRPWSAILGVLVPGLLATPLLISASRLTDVRTRQRAAVALLERTAEDAGRIVMLRASRQTVAERKRPDQDVIARVNAALAEAGIPADRFGGLRPESDAALPGAGLDASLRRQSLRIMLRDLNVPELGAFLERWAATQELWTPARVELSHARNEAQEGRYDVSLMIAATYIAEQ